ncbi:hypothetical protein D3C81_1845380 [compost metagenome]
MQSIRYGEELEVVIRIEPGTKQASISKLPLVENVFVHPLADKLTATARGNHILSM